MPGLWTWGIFLLLTLILLEKLGLRLNVANYLKDYRRTSKYLATVMFRGTPCILYSIFFSNITLNLHYITSNAKQELDKTAILPNVKAL